MPALWWLWQPATGAKTRPATKSLAASFRRLILRESSRSAQQTHSRPPNVRTTSLRLIHREDRRWLTDLPSPIWLRPVTEPVRQKPQTRRHQPITHQLVTTAEL